MSFHKRDCLWAIIACQNLVAVSREYSPGHFSKCVLVVDDQHGFGPAEISRRGRCDGYRSRSICSREEQAANGTDAGFGEKLDVSTGLCDDTEDHWEPKTGAFATGLGGKERLEDMIEHVLLHARTRISDR